MKKTKNDGTIEKKANANNRFLLNDVLLGSFVLHSIKNFMLCRIMINSNIPMKIICEFIKSIKIGLLALGAHLCWQTAPCALAKCVLYHILHQTNHTDPAHGRSQRKCVHYICPQAHTFMEHKPYFKNALTCQSG